MGAFRVCFRAREAGPTEEWAPREEDAIATMSSSRIGNGLVLCSFGCRRSHGRVFDGYFGGRELGSGTPYSLGLSMYCSFNLSTSRRFGLST